MMLFIHLLAVICHALPLVLAILDFDCSLGIEDMSLWQERLSVFKLVKVPGRGVPVYHYQLDVLQVFSANNGLHEHHVPALVRDRTVAAGTG